MCRRHNFQFTDRLAASGITFKHRIVDDAGKTYKAAHYDHGNGIAMADVDGDGLLDTDGLGAVVKVTGGGSTYTKVYDGDSGYLSHSLYPLYFGLGTAEGVDKIEVQWPSGKKQAVDAAIKVNATIEIREK